MERQTKLIRREPHPSLFCKEELKRIGRLEEERREDRGKRRGGGGGDYSEYTSRSVYPVHHVKSREGGKQVRGREWKGNIPFSYSCVTGMDGINGRRRECCYTSGQVDNLQTEY